jgi:hypothetical protein
MSDVTWRHEWRHLGDAGPSATSQTTEVVDVERFAALVSAGNPLLTTRTAKTLRTSNLADSSWR